VWILFILSYLDRGNIGNAKAAGAQLTLGLSSSQVVETPLFILWKTLSYLEHISIVVLGTPVFLYHVHVSRVVSYLLESLPSPYIRVFLMFWVSGSKNLGKVTGNTDYVTVGVLQRC
jgi:hypothetical protein